MENPSFDFEKLKFSFPGLCGQLDVENISPDNYSILNHEFIHFMQVLRCPLLARFHYYAEEKLSEKDLRPGMASTLGGELAAAHKPLSDVIFRPYNNALFRFCFSSPTHAATFSALMEGMACSFQAIALDTDQMDTTDLPRDYTLIADMYRDETRRTKLSWFDHIFIIMACDRVLRAIRLDASQNNYESASRIPSMIRKVISIRSTMAASYEHLLTWFDEDLDELRLAPSDVATELCLLDAHVAVVERVSAQINPTDAARFAIACEVFLSIHKKMEEMGHLMSTAVPRSRAMSRYLEKIKKSLPYLDNELALPLLCASRSTRNKCLQRVVTDLTE